MGAARDRGGELLNWPAIWRRGALWRWPWWRLRH